jgi:hypothetical protein
MVESAGFRVEQAGRPYAVPFGAGYSGGGVRAARALAHTALTAVVARGRGVPHAAVLAVAV